MKSIWVVLVSTILCGSGMSQPDTLLIKQEIDALQTTEDRSLFLAKLNSLHRDTIDFRQDMENLVSAAYFLNTYGWPDRVTYGNAYKIFPLLFEHTVHEALSRLVFPLIHKANQAKYISETQIRTKYLKPLYERKFEDEDYKTMPLDKLYTVLDLNTTGIIPLRTLNGRIQDIIAFTQARKIEVIQFKAPYHEKEVIVNGTKVKMAVKSSPAEIFTLEDGRVFFQKTSPGEFSEPQELILIGSKKYKFRNQDTFNYLEIDAEGNLLYRNQGEIIDLYKKA